MAKYFITYGNAKFELAKKRIEQEAINLNIFDKIILYSEKDISDEDLVLREGDRLIVPQYDGTVKINGAVMFANTVAYVKGEQAITWTRPVASPQMQSRARHTSST